MTRLLLLFGLLVATLSAHAQTGVLKGTVRDKLTNEGVYGAIVTIVGTYKGAQAEDEGAFVITDIKAGEYSVRVAMQGFAEQIITGVKIVDGQTKTLNVLLTEQTQTLETVEIIGEKNMVDLESGRSETKLNAESLKNLSVTDVQSIAAMQVGVNQTPDGIQIRGGRVYETQYYVDGVNAQSRLGGTGFGVDVAKNAISEIDIITGGAGPEFSGATSGLILTRIKEGGEKYEMAGAYSRDNLGFNKNSNWNSDNFSLSVGGPVVPNLSHRDTSGKRLPVSDKHISRKLFFFLSGDVRLTDEYTSLSYAPAKQLHSSLNSNGESFAPRQDNRWSGTAKLTYHIKPGIKITLSTQQSLTINQNTRSLQIVGNNQILSPGFQFPFALDLDNAQTYTQQSNLTVLNFKTTLGSRFTMNMTLGRLFSNLRADANGRPFRDAVPNQVYDPASIVTDPVTVWNPTDDSIRFVNPSQGLINNGGIAGGMFENLKTSWHDHYEQEYTFKTSFTYAPAGNVHFFSFGVEHKEQEFQWVDVQRPWIGAPYILGGDTLSSNRVGTASEIWRVKPAEGGLFFEDKIRYHGIIASIGFKLAYWAPGKYADDAVQNMDNPLTQSTRDAYQKETFGFAGRRWKARLLPNLNVAFPISENNSLYFNYSHTMRTQHPRFLYSGLDPKYLTRGGLTDLGNPNLNPETAVSYEVGLKRQFTSNLALQVSAFYKDQFDFVTSSLIQVRNPLTGGYEQKSFYINQDYARSRGLEVTLRHRIGSWLLYTLSGSYTAATGKSNTAQESKLAIQNTGRVSPNKEYYLAWNQPLDLKGTFTFVAPKNFKPWGIPLQHFVATVFVTWRSGQRYTPMKADTLTEYGRMEYVPDPDAERSSKIGSSWFWTDIRIQREFPFGKDKKSAVSLVFEIKNVFDNKNAQSLNPVTGKAYEFGDQVPATWRDPAYNHPLNRGAPPNNPARYMSPRQLMLGLNFRI